MSLTPPHPDFVPVETKPANRILYPELDGLRAVAFLMVFLQHYLFLPWCLTGVNLFFVLSGFLITGILIDTRDAPHRARNFYMRRTLRIFPLYYGICIAVVALYPVFHWQWSWPWVAWPLYVANFLPFTSPLAAIHTSALHTAGVAQLHATQYTNITYNFGHFWSLCVEEQFYLFWPWVVFYVRRRHALLLICVAAVVGVPLLRLATQHYAPSWVLSQDVLFRATPFQLDGLILGGLMAILWRIEHLRERLLYTGRVLAVLCAALALGYLAMTLHPVTGGDWRHAYVYPSWSRTWG